MDYLKQLFNQKNAPEIVLSIIFVIYLVLGLKLPENVSIIIDTSIGKLIIVIIALALFAYSNPVLGILSLLIAYNLIKDASTITGTSGMDLYYPTEQKKWSPFTPTKQFPYTLEQEIVKKMTTQKFNTKYVKAPFKPVLEDTHNASQLNK